MSRLSLPVRPLPPTGTVGVLHDAEFLLFVGNKVREARSRRGMTRKMLAHEADVSERHLAQLELGEGNVSIVLLRRITTALNIPIAEVFTADKPNAEAEDALRRILERIPGASLERMTWRDADESL
jgi:XRE family aerobic/anaerobic benzoate catabolism transcriptional regulator